VGGGESSGCRIAQNQCGKRGKGGVMEKPMGRKAMAIVSHTDGNRGLSRTSHQREVRSLRGGRERRRGGKLPQLSAPFVKAGVYVEK